MDLASISFSNFALSNKIINIHESLMNVVIDQLHIRDKVFHYF